MTLADFDKMLAAFDWAYEFSDDARVYRRSSLDHQALRALAGVNGPEFEELLTAYQDVYFYRTSRESALQSYRTLRGLA